MTPAVPTFDQAAYARRVMTPTPGVVVALIAST
jgi:hypothetical protein